jgi:hypothetical protein
MSCMCEEGATLPTRGTEESMERAWLWREASVTGRHVHACQQLFISRQQRRLIP